MNSRVAMNDTHDNLNENEFFFEQKMTTASKILGPKDMKIPLVSSTVSESLEIN